MACLFWSCYPSGSCRSRPVTSVGCWCGWADLDPDSLPCCPAVGRSVHLEPPVHPWGGRVAVEPGVRASLAWESGAGPRLPAVPRRPGPPAACGASPGSSLPRPARWRPHAAHVTGAQPREGGPVRRPRLGAPPGPPGASGPRPQLERHLRTTRISNSWP